MAASYNTFLLPQVKRELLLAAIENAIHRLGHRIVHFEAPDSYEAGFQYPSVSPIFIGPSNGSGLIPISSWGDGVCPFPQGYRSNPLALNLSWTLSPIITIFSYNAGSVAGYSIFDNGQHVEAQSVTWQSEYPLNEFTPRTDSMLP